MREYSGTLQAVSYGDRSFWSPMYRFDRMKVGEAELHGLEATPEVQKKIREALGKDVTLYVVDSLVAGIRIADGPTFCPAPQGYLVGGLLLLALGVPGWLVILPGMICWALAVPLLHLYWVYRGMQRMPNIQRI